MRGELGILDRRLTGPALDERDRRSTFALRAIAGAAGDHRAAGHTEQPVPIAAAGSGRGKPDAIGERQFEMKHLGGGGHRLQCRIGRRAVQRRLTRHSKRRDRRDWPLGGRIIQLELLVGRVDQQSTRAQTTDKRRSAVEGCCRFFVHGLTASERERMSLSRVLPEVKDAMTLIWGANGQKLDYRVF